MGRKQERTPGLVKKGNVWHIEKRGKYFQNGRLRESTGETDLKKAEEYLARRVEEFRAEAIFGVRKKRTFEEAATKYVNEHVQKASITDDLCHLKQLMPYIGQLTLPHIHDGTLAGFVSDRQKTVKNKTINLALEVVRHILSLAARSWRDDRGKTWLDVPPLITMLSIADARKPYPLSWDEQKCLVKALPDHLAKMMLFKVNTGIREQEVCRLEWNWEVSIPELNTSVFLIPEGIVKNREERLVVLNDIAKSIVDSQRDLHHRYVFPHKDGKLNKINNSAWRRKRREAALSLVERNPDCDYISEQMHTDGNTFEIEIRCKRHSRNKVIITRYTIKDENRQRKVKGLTQLTSTQIASPQLKQVMRHKAFDQFIEKQWPEYRGFSKVRVHDIKHTFGRRLRAAGVSHETRKVLLGHKNGDITSHYGAPEIEELLGAAQKVVGGSDRKMPALTLLKRKMG